MSSAKTGLLAFLLVTPFGLAGYEDFVNHGPVFGGSAEARDVDRLVDRLGEDSYDKYADVDLGLDHGGALDPEPEPDIYDSPLGTLVITLGNQPEVLGPRAFVGLDVDGFEATEVLDADESAVGLSLSWSDPKVQSEALFDDAWGVSQQYTALSGGEHLFWFDAGSHETDTSQIPVAVRAMLRRGVDDSPATVSLELREVRNTAALVKWLLRYMGRPARDLAGLINADPGDNPMVYRDTLPTEMALEPTQIRVYHRVGKLEETGPSVDFIERIVIGTDYALDRSYVDRFAESLVDQFGEGASQVVKDTIVRTYRAKPMGLLIRGSGSLVLKDKLTNHRLTIELIR